MPNLVTKLLELYMPLAGGVLLGGCLGYLLPKSVPADLGQFLFWVGVPIGVIAFLRQADLSGAIWLAPVAAWAAILLGGVFAWAWIKVKGKSHNSFWSQPSQGTFLLASMFGNTGYLGYPVTLALVGQQYFGWALFYDLLGTTLGAYGLGVALAARFGKEAYNYRQLGLALLKNPTLWSFGFGLAYRDLPLPQRAEWFLETAAWATVGLALVLIGMRLSELRSWGSLSQTAIALSIKMLLVPLILGMGLRSLGVTGAPGLAIVLQMAMPPAFATLILAEAYGLDRDLAVTTVAGGSIGLLFALPIWLWLFGV